MRMDRLGVPLAATILLCVASSASAQERSADNAVTQAEDGFGFSVGRESLGIYSSSNARGFSPSAAGNLRIDGLYYDSAFNLTSTISDSSVIRVGLSAQGYPFAAPSGIVDLSLRRPGDQAAASIVLNGDSYGSYGLEIDGSLPLSRRLSVGYGITGNRTAFADGTDNVNHGQAIVVRWRPASGIEVLPFWSLYNDYHDEAGPFFLPATAVLPPNPPEHRFDGPPWAQFRYVGANYGTLVSAALGRNWLLRVGAFRSVNDQLTAFTNLYAGEQPDGTADRIVIADPREKNASWSGEARLTHSIVDGPRLHVIHLSLRERDARHQFGGSATVDLGPGRTGVPFDPVEPAFAFGPTSRDRVRQATYGVAYDGRWKKVGEISFGLSRADYDKATTLPGASPVETRSHPWLYNGTFAAYPSSSLSFYAGYARGLEQSGVAPQTATNRNQPLPAILTSQTDAGLRWNPIGNLKLVGGIFDLRKPYFGFNAAGTYTQIGTTRSRGAEVSVAGRVTGRVDIVVGGVFIDPRVERDPTALGAIGSRPVGLPGHSINANVNWRTPLVSGLSLDAAITQRSSVPSTTDNLVALPPRTLVNLGGRYQFRLAARSATLRFQTLNVFDVRSFNIQGPGAYGANAGRSATAYLAIDV